MTTYVGSNKIKDTDEHGVYYGSIPINAVYNGSDLVYQYIPTAKTFSAATNFQTYVVPKGITKLQVDCVAASGHNNRGGDTYGGAGGRVQCTLSVTPGQILYLWVPVNPTGQTYSQELAYNAADIRTNNAGVIDNTSLQSRLIVAGGGGEYYSGTSYSGVGGVGGGLTGGDGANCTYGGGGKGGTQTAGGAGGGSGGGIGGGSGKAGTFGLGGVSYSGGGTVWRGVGGAGWYGGGSGGASAYYGDGQGGGGGGSSYTHPNLCTNVIHTQGFRNGAGYITITPIK